VNVQGPTRVRARRRGKEEVLQMINGGVGFTASRDREGCDFGKKMKCSAREPAVFLTRTCKLQT